MLVKYANILENNRTGFSEFPQENIYLTVTAVFLLNLSEFLLQMMTDLNYGTGMDRVVKQQSEWNSTYMYIFHWKSWNDWLPWYLGWYTSHSIGFGSKTFPRYQTLS